MISPSKETDQPPPFNSFYDDVIQLLSNGLSLCDVTVGSSVCRSVWGVQSEGGVDVR